MSNRNSGWIRGACLELLQIKHLPAIPTLIISFSDQKGKVNLAVQTKRRKITITVINFLNIYKISLHKKVVSCKSSFKLFKFAWKGHCALCCDSLHLKADSQAQIASQIIALVKQPWVKASKNPRAINDTNLYVTKSSVSGLGNTAWERY